MSTSEFDRLATEVGREIVAQAAPQELPLYRSISQSYLEAPEQIDRKTVSKDEMLGFGVGAAVTYLTPTLLAVLSWVLKFLAEELKSSVHDQHLVGDILKKLFSKPANAPVAKTAEVALTHDQLERIRKLAYDKGRELKLKNAEASLLADAIIGKLAISA